MLSKNQILGLLKNDPPLIEGLIDENKQVQPSGVDFSLKEIERFTEEGHVDFDNSERKIPKPRKLNQTRAGSSYHKEFTRLNSMK